VNTTAPWVPHSGGTEQQTYADAAYQLGCDDGWCGRPRVAPAAWPQLADDYRSGWIAGWVTHEQAQVKKEAA